MRKGETPNKDISPIGMWPNLSRAYEVAKVGGFGISPYISNGLKSEYKTAFEDFRLIESFYNDIIFYGEAPALFVELEKPSLYWRVHETKEQILVRVAKANDFRESLGLHSFRFKDTASETIFGTCYERLGLSIASMELLKDISLAISILGHSEAVRVEDIAEAAQYMGRSWSKEDYVMDLRNELGKIRFGQSISIEAKVAFMESDDLERAIAYLQSLK